MFPKVTIFVLFFSKIFGVEIETRIVNGTNAEHNEFPDVVSLRTYKSHTCGGTILNDRFILTAAHCVPCGKNPDGMSVQYGSRKISATSERSIDVKKINCNGYYDTKKMIADIAVLELAWPIPPGNWKPITIARSYDGRYGQTGVFVGWGRLSTHGAGAKILQKATVNVYSDQTCAKTNNELHHHICVGAPDVGACFGDSGTALFINGVQAGVASYISHDECGISDEFHPNVYSKVATYYPWIVKIAGLYESNGAFPYNPYPGSPGVYNPTVNNLYNMHPTAGSYNSIQYNPYPYAPSYNYPSAGFNINRPPTNLYNYNPNSPVNFNISAPNPYSQYPNGGSYNPYFNGGFSNNPFIGGGLYNPYNLRH